MPAHDQPADADRIQRFAKRMKDRWTNQKLLDDAQLALINHTNRNLTAKADAPKTDAFQSGIGRQVWMEDSAILSITPFLRVNAPEDDQDERDHANMLERWLSGAWRRSQANGEVFLRKAPMMRAIGRAWSAIELVPGMWVTPEMTDLVAKLQETNDDDEIQRYLKELKRWKQSNFPIRWRYVEFPTMCYTTFGGNYPQPQVVEVVEMSRAQIVEDFGEDALPGDAERGGNSKIDVYRWANYAESATVIASGDDPKMVDHFVHDMGINPYLLMEETPLLENDKGWRWAGILFNAENLIDKFDQILTDLTNNHHEWTQSPIVIKHDKDRYEESGETSARPPPMPYGPGIQVDIWSTESIDKGPVGEINQQSILLLQEYKQLIQQNMYSPIQRGEAKAGSSNNLATTLLQVSEREFDPSLNAIRGAAKGAGKRFFRAVIALNAPVKKMAEETGDKDLETLGIDPVPVYSDIRIPKKGAIVEVTPKDVIGWEELIQARAEKALEMEEVARLRIAKLKVELGVSPEQVLEEDVGYEDAPTVLKRGREWALLEALSTQTMQAILALSGQMMASLSSQETLELQENFNSVPPDVQSIMTQLLTGGAAGGNGTFTQNTVDQQAVAQFPQDVTA